MKRIVIVGGGSAGLGALKALKESEDFQRGEWELIAFEQRDDIGGIWLPEDSPPTPPIDNPNDIPKSNLPATPLYNSLTTNLPHPIMAFRDFMFPPSTPLYPPARTVLQYLRDYAKAFELEQFIRFSTTVDNAEWNADEKTWTITTTTTEKAPDPSTSQKTNIWNNVDTLILGSGRHGYPYIPTSISNLDQWLELGKATHSMTYREPSPYTGKTVLVIGNGPSARDIAPEVSTVATKVYRSCRGKPINNPWDREYDVEVCGEVERLSDASHNGDGVKAFLKDGTILEGIQAVIVATGYTFSYSFFPPTFLHGGFPPLPASNEASQNNSSDGVPSMEHLYCSGRFVWPLSLHMIPITPSLPNGALFFLGLPRPTVPFPFVEAQVRLISSFLSASKPVVLDRDHQIEEVRRRYKELLELVSNGADDKKDSKHEEKLAKIATMWHLLPQDDIQFDYRAHLSTLIGDDPKVTEIMVPAWQRRIYNVSAKLREIWKDLEKKGKAKEIVKGVGNGDGEKGEEEWVELMERVLLMGPPSHNVAQDRSNRVTSGAQGTAEVENIEAIGHAPEPI